jgi:glycosyltransferase involved in cell wall biosynthesis
MTGERSAALRILYHHRIAAADGMRVHVDELVGALRAAGHVVEVVGPAAGADIEAGGASELERLADRLRRRLPPAAFEALELAYNLRAYARLSAAAAQFQPDVIYERYNLFLLAGLALKRRLRVPYLLEVNSPLASERAAFGKLQLKPVARACEAALWRGADGVLAVTEVLAERVRETRRGLAGVHVIPNGANLEVSAAAAAAPDIRARLGLPAEALVLGFVGFVRGWHGVGWALEALPDLPRRTCLVVVGDGPALADLQRRAGELGIADRVRLLGRVPHGEVAGYARGFDIALQTAAVPYASPLKLFEYMALGRTIVAPDQPNIREVLTEGYDALLFAPGDERSFRATLQTLLSDDALRARLGAAARRTLRDTPYTWAHNATRIEAIARALISRAELAPRPAYAASPA